jgi:hypothetical protein
MNKDDPNKIKLPTKPAGIRNNSNANVVRVKPSVKKPIWSGR